MEIGQTDTIITFKCGYTRVTITEVGKWISYVHDKPDSGEVTRKHTWVVRHDGLFFGSGWYEQK